MLDSFFDAAVFLKDLIAESIAAEESFGILGDHLAKSVNIHRLRFQCQAVLYHWNGGISQITTLVGVTQVFLGYCGWNKRTGGVCGRGSFGFHGHRANTGVWERGAAGHIEFSV